MLGKLIKHEWKNIYKVGCTLTLAIAVISVMGCIMLQLPAMTALISESSSMNDMQTVIWTLMGVMSLMIYIFMLMGATYGLFIFLGIRFYRTMYTDQGYLTNTLPVTSHQLLISKILVSGIWYFIIEVVVFASMIALVLAMLSGLFADTMVLEGYKNIWEVLAELFSEMSNVYEEMGLDIVRYGIGLLVMILVGPFTTMTVLFGSITLGQLSRKHKAVMGILAYFGVMFLNMIVASIVQGIATFRYTYEMMNNEYGDMTVNMNSSYESSFLTVTILAIVLYLTSHYILTKKLNMD